MTELIPSACRPGLPPNTSSKCGDLGVFLGRAVVVLDQPADRRQASPRAPSTDQVAVDIGAVAGDDVVEVLLVCEREGGEVEQRVALGGLGPVDDAGDLAIFDEDV